MGQVVVWENGDETTGRYKVSSGKTAVSANIEAIATGIKVDWGLLGEEIIEGSNWNTTQGTGWTEVWRASPPSRLDCIGNIIRGYSKYFTTAGTYRTFQINPATGGISRGGNQSTTQTLRVEYHAGFTTVDCTGRTFSVPTSRYQSLSSGGNWNNLSTNSQGSSGWTIYGVERFASSWFKVQSNLGDISYRTTNIPPAVSLLSGGCGVGINFSDGSNIIIPLSSCPAWVRIEDDQACPQGSCECVHGSEKCCFDPNSGVIIKKIRLV